MMNNMIESQTLLHRSHARARSNAPPLPRSVQEPLGRELRAEYFKRGDRPKYLGDPALPLKFDLYLYCLEQVERASRLARIREHGGLAVADALSDLIR